MEVLGTVTGTVRDKKLSSSSEEIIWKHSEFKKHVRHDYHVRNYGSDLVILWTYFRVFWQINLQIILVKAQVILVKISVSDPRPLKKSLLVFVFICSSACIKHF